MYQIRTEQIEFVIQSDEPTHQFVLHLAVHQFIVLSYPYRDFVFDRLFACRKPHFNFRVTCPAERARAEAKQFEKHPPLLTEGRGASLGYRGHGHEQTFGSGAGHVGHVAAENSCA